MNWFDAQAENFYVEGLKELVLRYKKCLEANGDYVQIKILFLMAKLLFLYEHVRILASIAFKICNTF